MNSSLSEKEEVFPYLAVGSLCVGMLAHTIIFTSPLPYVAFMVVDFRMSSNLDTAGYAAGWIASVFMIGRLMSGIPWGMASDKWGRKPCLILSMVNACIFGSLFGMSSNFTMAIITRCLIGIGNGFMGIAKTSLSEIVKTKEHEMRAFGYINGVYGLGLIVGPVIGGLLARPALQYPNIFAADSLWGQHPYLLPCLVCAGFAAASAVLISLFMDETLPSKCAVIESNMLSASSDIESEGNIEMAISSGLHNDHKTESQSTFKPLAASEEDVDDNQTDYVTSSSSSKSQSSTDSTPSDFSSSSVSGPENVLSVADILRNRHLSLLLGIYLAFCFVVVFIEETFPLWAVSSAVHGGLAWSSAQVGAVLAVVGVGLIVFQLFLYEPAMKYFFHETSPEVVFYYQVMVFAVSIIAMPTLTALSNVVFGSSHHSTLSLYSIYSIVVLTFTVYTFCVGSSYSTISIVINASVEPGMRGTMNGLVMTAGSIGNFLGPVAGSCLYAGAVSVSDHVPFRQYLAFDGRVVFVFAGLLAVVLAKVVRSNLSTSGSGSGSDVVSMAETTEIESV